MSKPNLLPAHYPQIASHEIWRQKKLAEFPVLIGMPDSLIKSIATNSIDWYAKGRQLLYIKNDPENYLCFVLRGHIHHVLQAEDGHEIIFNTSHWKDLVGETALFNQGNRAYTTIAESNSHLLLLNKNFFGELRSNSEFIYRIQNLLCTQIQRNTQFLETICLHKLEARLARYLLAQASSFGIKKHDGILIPIPPNQSILASMLHISRPKLNIKLQEWLQDGMIKRHELCLLINDTKRLQKIAKAN